jgi:hypothetical protein
MRFGVLPVSSADREVANERASGACEGRCERCGGCDDNAQR